ncbi:unnamed protein product [Paramecium octaurelia]|uniref:Uncharacterized protein n=1 Tax=Paramecium octaurelia TaxID=43137 RepID=A0A8S1UQX0_PAROT|nr:unnamed protein product [Paramecium octaurelia]
MNNSKGLKLVRCVKKQFVQLRVRYILDHSNIRLVCLATSFQPTKIPEIIQIKKNAKFGFNLENESRQIKQQQK